MDEKKILLNDVAKTNPFKVPEGYFENFTNGIMSQLPEHAPNHSIVVNWRQRVRPWIYMAAMFAGIALMLRLFTGAPAFFGSKNYASEGFNLTSSSSDIDDYYQYYEDGLARLAYDDTFYLNYTEDTN